MVASLRPDVSVSDNSKTKLTREEALDYFKKMALIRRFEERAEEAYGQGKIGGFLHLYIGEEAIAVGAMAALAPDDDVVTHYRDHGYAIARGVDPKRVMAELYGKVTGLDKGKGGSMHLADVSKHLWGGYAIVGGHVPLAAGLALSHQYLQEPRIAASFLGEGATNIGTFFSGLNMAAVWKLPLLIIVENNRYGMGTAVERASAVVNIAEKACAFNIPSVQIDGDDVIKVRDAVHEMAEKARRGEGPQMIEAVTYRYRGHSMGDPQRYRTKEEVEQARQLDPIMRFRERILKEGLVTKEDLDRIEREVENEVNDALEFAETSPEPGEKEMYEDVLVPEA